MAARVPLPKVSALPDVILFHREDPREPILILQVPNADKSDAQTYIVRLDNMADVGWLETVARDHVKELRNLIDMEPHVVYHPTTGEMSTIADLDAPSPMQQFMDRARSEGSHSEPHFLERLSARRRLVGRTGAPQMSPLRQALSGRRVAPGFGGMR